MKILLVGEFYSDNLGDPLLCRTVEKLIRQEYPQAEIVPFDLSGRVSKTEYYQPQTSAVMDRVSGWARDRFLYYRRAAILRACEKDRDRALRVWYRLKHLQKQHRFDLVIFAGGALFMDYFAGMIHLIIRCFAFSRTKILFHACGMGPLDEDAVYLLRQVLASRRVVSVSLRDSYDRFTALFPTKASVTETFDTALNCSLLYAGAKEKKYPLGIGLIDRCRDQQLELLRYVMGHGTPWKAFTNGSVFDYAYAKGLLTDAGIPEDRLAEYLLPRPESEEELVRTVTAFERIIAFRMHCQIVAASFGVPSVGIAWDKKLMEFYGKLGFPQGCTEQTENFDAMWDQLLRYEPLLRDRALAQGEESRNCLIRAIAMALGK